MGCQDKNTQMPTNNGWTTQCGMWWRSKTIYQLHKHSCISLETQKFQRPSPTSLYAKSSYQPSIMLHLPQTLAPTSKRNYNGPKAMWQICIGQSSRIPLTPSFPKTNVNSSYSSMTSYHSMHQKHILTMALHSAHPAKGNPRMSGISWMPPEGPQSPVPHP